MHLPHLPNPTLAVSIALALVMAVAQPVAASPIEVADRDGAALAAAIEAGNTAAGETTIHLAAGGLYTFDGAPGTVALPTVTGRLVIDGRGAEIRRWGRGPLGLVEVAEGGALELRNLTLAEGNDGAIRNRGTLGLHAVQVVDSSGDGPRGVVVNHGTLRVTDSLIGYNRVDAVGRDAGTVVNHGEMSLVRTRIEYNRLSRRWPSPAVAGAVLNRGLLQVEDVVFVANGIDDGHGGLAVDAVLNLDNGRVEGELEKGELVEERHVAVSR